MDGPWATIPYREIVAEGQRWVYLTPEEAKLLVDSREVEMLLYAIEELSSGDAQPAITVETITEGGETKNVWAVIEDLFDEAPTNRVAHGGKLIETLEGLVRAMADGPAGADFEGMDAVQLMESARQARDSLDHGYLAWRCDAADPNTDVVELWDASSDVPDILGIGHGDDDVEAMRNLLIGLREKGVLSSE